MHTAISKIDTLLRVLAEIAAHARVPHVGAGKYKFIRFYRRTAIGSTNIHVYHSAQTTAAQLHEALCPRRFWQRYFETHSGSHGAFNHAGCFAVGGLLGC